MIRAWVGRCVFDMYGVIDWDGSIILSCLMPVIERQQRRLPPAAVNLPLLMSHALH